MRVLKSYLSNQQFSILSESETAFASWQSCLHCPLPTMLPERRPEHRGPTRLWTQGLDLGFRLDAELLCDLAEMQVPSYISPQSLRGKRRPVPTSSPACRLPAVLTDTLPRCGWWALAQFRKHCVCKRFVLGLLSSGL